LKFIYENIVIAKSITGIYRIVDLRTGEIIKTIRSNIASAGGQIVNFTMSPKNDIVFDVLTSKEGTNRIFSKIDIDTGEVNSMYLAEDTRLISGLSYNAITDRVQFMHMKSVGYVEEELKELVEIYEIDYHLMEYNLLYSELTSIDYAGILFFDYQYLLNKHGEIIDIYSRKTINKIDFDLVSFTKHDTHPQVFLHKANNYLVLVSSMRIVILNFHTGDIIWEHDQRSKYYRLLCAYFIGDNLFIGTDGHVIVLENPLQ
jgi:hypothetical protein